MKVKFTFLRLASAAVMAMTAGFAGAATYTWNGSGTATYQTSTCWTPTRTTPATSDILIFDGSTGTGAPTFSVAINKQETVTSIRFVSGAQVTFVPAATSIITCNSTSAIGTGTEAIQIASGTRVTFGGSAGAFAMICALTATAFGYCDGDLVFSPGFTSSAGSRLASLQTSGFVFRSGSNLYECPTAVNQSVGVFGVNAGGAATTTVANGVLFQSGSTYIHGLTPAGALSLFYYGSPQQLTQPSSMVVFNSGSTYKAYDCSSGLSTSGRTYANYTLFTRGNIGASGSGAFTMNGDCTLSPNSFGTQTLQTYTNTGGVNINGNLNIQTGSGGMSLQNSAAGNYDITGNITAPGLFKTTTTFPVVRMTGTGTTVTGDFSANSLANLTVTNSSAAGVTFTNSQLTVSTAFQVSAGSKANVAASGTLKIDGTAVDDGTLSIDGVCLFGCTGLTGIGSVAFNSGSTLGYGTSAGVINDTIGSPVLANSGGITVNSNHNITYSGSCSQVTGAGLISPYGKILTFANTAGTTASAPITIDTGGQGFVTAGKLFLDGQALACNGPFSVNNGGTLVCDAAAVTGSSTFALNSGGSLTIPNAAGLDASGATGQIQTAGGATFSTTANYTYTGSAAQITGSGLPASSTSVVVGTSSGSATAPQLDLTADHTTTLNMLSGELTVGVPRTLALTGTNFVRDNSILTVNGTINSQGANVQNGLNSAAGGGTVNLNSGATLRNQASNGLVLASTNYTAGIFRVLNRNMSTGANYIYEKTTSTNNTGDGLPSTVASLQFMNPSGTPACVLTASCSPVILNVASGAALSVPTGVTLSDSGTGTFTTTGSITIASGATFSGSTNSMIGSGNFTSSAGSTIVTKHTSGLNGYFTNSGTNTFPATAAHTFNAAGPQVTGALFTGATTLTIDNISNVTLSGNASASTALALTNGKLVTGANTLTLGVAGTSSGTFSNAGGGYVIGTLKRGIPAGTGTIAFPIGTASIARTSSVNFTGAPGTGGSITASFTASDPGNTGLPLAADSSIGVTNQATDGFWTLAAGDGLAGGTYNASFDASSFSPAPGVSTWRIIKRTNGGSAWALEGSNAANVGNTINRSGLTSFSDFGIGYDGVQPVVGSVATVDHQNVTVTFTDSSDMDSVSRSTASNYTISGAGQGTLTSTPDSVTNVGANGVTLTWNTGSTVTGQPVTVTVSPSVVDAAGNALSGSSNFGTDASALPVSVSAFNIE